MHRNLPLQRHVMTFAALAAAAFGASAQSAVTLYGVVDLGIESTKLSPGPSVLALSSSIQSGSRWGVKGTEDLGGGLKASFQLESGFDASTGAASQGGLAFGRQAWVGIGGGFGSVKFGRQYVPYFLAQDTVDPFGTGLTGDGSGMIAVFRPYGVRMNNTIDYSTPTFGGFSAEIAYGLGEVPGSSSTGRQISLSGTYESGPLTLVAAYHDQGLVTGGTVNAGNAKSYLLGGTYDFTAAKLHGAWADNRDENSAGTTTNRSRDYMVGVSVPVGAFSLMASYIRHQDQLVSGADANYTALGATYALSKRTNFYASYSTIRNGAAGTMGSGGAGVDISWTNVGVRHKF